MKPPIGYLGSKASMAPDLVARMPPHRAYIEPYAGSLAVLLAKPRAQLEVVNDLDGRLMTFWRVLRDRPGELLHLAELTPASRQESMDSFQLDAPDELHLAWQVWVALTQGRARSLATSGWRGKYTTETLLTDDLARFRARLLPAAARLRDVTLENRDALQVISDYGADPGALLYVDPPYLGETRRGGTYGIDQPGAAHHLALAEVLHQVRGTVMLAGYPSPLYDQLYPDWWRLDVGVTTANAVSGTGARIEAVWSNRDIDSAALW